MNPPLELLSPAAGIFILNSGLAAGGSVEGIVSDDDASHRREDVPSVLGLYAAPGMHITMLGSQCCTAGHCGDVAARETGPAIE